MPRRVGAKPRYTFTPCTRGDLWFGFGCALRGDRLCWRLPGGAEHEVAQDGESAPAVLAGGVDVAADVEAVLGNVVAGQAAGDLLLGFQRADAALRDCSWARRSCPRRTGGRRCGGRGRIPAARGRAAVWCCSSGQGRGARSRGRPGPRAGTRAPAVSARRRGWRPGPARGRRARHGSGRAAPAAPARARPCPGSSRRSPHSPAASETGMPGSRRCAPTWGGTNSGSGRRPRSRRNRGGSRRLAWSPGCGCPARTPSTAR